MYNILIQLNSNNKTANIQVYDGSPTVFTVVTVNGVNDILDVLNALGYELGELLAVNGNRANYLLYV